MEKIYLSVIVPAYNEELRLPLTLIELDKVLCDSDFSYEILVVNDGSTDKTSEIIKKMQGDIKNLRLIDNKFNKGKGGVVKQGMLESKGAIRLFTDADNSTSIGQFRKMIPFFNDGYGVVIGSRALKESRLEPPQPFIRQVLGKLGNVFIRIMVLPGIYDTQCGFKAFTEEAAKKIFPLVKITGWGFDVEVLALAKKMGYKIKEVPVVWVNDTRSHVGAKAYLQVLIETIKIRWWLWSKQYKIN